MMDKIWANRLIAGDRQWVDVPTARKNAVKIVLFDRVSNGIITPEQYENIVGEKYEEKQS